MTMATTGSVAGSSTLRAVEIDPRSDARWDDFVRRADGGEFYHLGAWQRVLEQTYGYRPICLAVEQPDGGLAGAMPLALLSSSLTGRKLVSLPFSDVCGPLAADDGALRALLDRAMVLLLEHGARSLQIRTHHAHLEALAPSLAADARYADFVLALSSDPEVVWRSPAIGKVRTLVRKARKSGLTVDAVALGSGRSGEPELAAFYRLHLKTTKKHGMPAQPFAFFRSLWRHLAPACELRLLLARHEGRPVAASLFVGFRDTVHHLFNASERSALSLGPNDLVLWEAIEWACRMGYERFSFGKTSLDNAGLVHFKRGWGAAPVPLRYYYHPHVAGLTSTAYGEHSRKHQAITALWRTLPAPVTDRLGPLLYGYLA